MKFTEGPYVNLHEYSLKHMYQKLDCRGPQSPMQGYHKRCYLLEKPSTMNYIFPAKVVSSCVARAGQNSEAIAPSLAYDDFQSREKHCHD